MEGTEWEMGGKGKARRPCPGNPNVVSHRDGVTEDLKRGVAGQLPLGEQQQQPRGQVTGGKKAGATGARRAPSQQDYRLLSGRPPEMGGQSSRRSRLLAQHP